jgi:cell shape-determining protein MreC
MKQKIITALLGIGVMGFLSKDKISEFINNKTAINQSMVILDTISTSEYVDTILEKSMKNITSIGEKNAKSDSMIVTKVEKTAKNIEVLNKEVKVLKKENNELKKMLNNTGDNIDEHFGLLPISTDAVTQ